MGNMIPHGDRIHECGPGCPEWSGKLMNIDTGKAEQVGNDCWGPEPQACCGRMPNEEHKVGCVHAEYMMRVDSVCDGKGSGADCDRGEFGMPGIGSPSRIFDWTFKDSSGDEVKPPPYFRVHVGDRIIKYVPEASEHVERPKITNMPWSPAEDFTAHRETMLLRSAPQTSLAIRILRVHLPEAMDHFLQRNAEYGDDNDFDLGSQGQYVDISRKVQKLKRRMWDRRPAREHEESTETIIMELIGHLLMTLDYLESEDGEATEG